MQARRRAEQEIQVWRSHGFHRAVSGLPKLRFEAAYDWNDAICRTEMSEQKFPARCFSECQLSTRVNRAEMIEILFAGWQSQ